jgi:hypothetical protein
VLLDTTDGKKERTGVPWIFLWNAQSAPTKDPVFGSWQTLRDLLEGLRVIRLDELLKNAIGALLANGCDYRHSPGRKTIVVLVGVWRPLPLGSNIFGLSNDNLARHIEIKAFTLGMTITGNILDDTTALKVIVADPIPSAELFRWVSGTPVLPYVGLLGCGALGSAIANHLLRGGVSGINAFDKDLLLPHNLARHTGRVSDLYRRKSKQVASLAEAISPLSKPVVRYLYGGTRHLSE